MQESEKDKTEGSCKEFLELKNKHYQILQLKCWQCKSKERCFNICTERHFHSVVGTLFLITVH